MRRPLAVSIAICFIACELLLGLGTATQNPSVAPSAYAQEYYPPAGFLSSEQLDNLLAPIALYPDPLLAQLLLAATFVDQVDEAARLMRAYNDPYVIDNQPWDVSVKAVAHYPPVLYMMSDRIDWTIAVGQAYVNQSTDVFASIQRLRAMAYSAGNLMTNQEQQVIVGGNYIQIVPIQPQFIYVPTYDPDIVYVARSPYFGGAYPISFGVGFVIGAWLNRDCDWGRHRVYYHGWRGGGWIDRSRPNVHITNVYVNNNYTNIRINRNIVQRNVNYNSLNRYTSVHRDVNYNNLTRDKKSGQSNPDVGNRIIRRNMDVTDRRIDTYRGRPPVQQPPAPEGRPSRVPPTPSTPLPRRQEKPPPAQALPQPPPGRVERPPQPQARPQPPPKPERGPSQAARPAPQPPPRDVQRPSYSVFGGDRSGFDPHAASQRGQASRARVNEPARKPPEKAPNRPGDRSRQPQERQR